MLSFPDYAERTANSPANRIGQPTFACSASRRSLLYYTNRNPRIAKDNQDQFTLIFRHTSAVGDVRSWNEWSWIGCEVGERIRISMAVCSERVAVRCGGRRLRSSSPGWADMRTRYGFVGKAWRAAAEACNAAESERHCHPSSFAADKRGSSTYRCDNKRPRWKQRKSPAILAMTLYGHGDGIMRRCVSPRIGLVRRKMRRKNCFADRCIPY
jgi:hypothetical protein